MKCKVVEIATEQLAVDNEGEFNFADDDFIALQVNDDNVYPFTCRRGHQNVMIQQDEKYELLFESASHAICDGYYKEAISSIASSLERLYEYCIKVICFKHKINQLNINESWKIVSSQSERQLGAFTYLYLLEFDCLPPKLSVNQTKFRNDVIHKGYFPTLENVLSFGEAVLKIVFEILMTLQKECKDTIFEWQRNRISDMSEQARQISETPMTLTSPTIISIALAENTIDSGTVLKDYLITLAGRQRK